MGKYHLVIFKRSLAGLRPLTVNGSRSMEALVIAAGGGGGADLGGGGGAGVVTARP